ncbi:hypothetical protein DENIS_1410 [Desulfonema ishimotonii]|uniref:Uncharacterized protein n=1 Tax=Desulfonema ishimotonii TaxID=45657 RepID=A0A401FTZ9_9BACT|nr:hypothetical protein [Desulfonema ishimotonii]GBC60457.1 hypothetical protein DENIS_1410 [Desulfonema ishimotonii]
MAGDLKARIRESIENLVTLEIITAVGHVQYNARGGEAGDTEQRLPDLDYTRDPKVILTRIDLLQGDIKTVYNEEFVTGNYQSLKEFHSAREKEGYEIVQKNIAAIERLLNLVNAQSEE